ncbi:Mss4-like protein [Cercophora newfieldiana]|uniref:Mss4-like protein n=1 Tax=Cercophora newfieldiana TaxID=92897 RepID=A0AA40D002_9PEZI|nr:Mss4-like protein [Cercophora newfieldiana]
MADDKISITAHCLCKAHSFTTTAPSSSLPLLASCCHCNSCRQTTGALYLPCTVWPNQSEDLSQLKRYPFSPNIDYYSCPTCSTHLFCKGTGPDDVPEVVTGSLVNSPNLIKYSHHGYVADTLDGGATVWFAKDDSGNPLPRWAGGRGKSEELFPTWPKFTAANLELKARPERTPLKCHCGGIDLVVHSAADLQGKPASELPWYVDPKTYRYFAATDVCDSCRLAYGVDVTNWTFVQLDHIEFPATEGGADRGTLPGSIAELKRAVVAEEKDPRLGKLAVYQSSSEVDRYFCSGCSAVVFYAVDVEGRKDMVDVAIGLLRHEDGARAEGLLTWNLGIVGWMDDTLGGYREGLARRVEQDAEEWRIARGYAKSWRRVMREEAARTS